MLDANALIAGDKGGHGLLSEFLSHEERLGGSRNDFLYMTAIHTRVFVVDMSDSIEVFNVT